MLKVNCKLKEWMKSNGLRQQDITNATGIRQSFISEMANSKRQSINVKHLEKIINTYGIEDISKLIEIEKM